MRNIVFFDTEVNPESGKILDFGAIKPDGSKIHTTSKENFSSFLFGCGYICGHNIIEHDLKYASHIVEETVPNCVPMDTLYLSPLLFPMKPYHSLLKDDKLQVDELNNPLHDSMKAMELFYDEVNAFESLPQTLKDIFCLLLNEKPGFAGFFRYLCIVPEGDVVYKITDFFGDKICSNADISLLARKTPTELAYTLALINTSDRYSVTPGWVMRNYPRMDNVMKLLRNTPCAEGCAYCSQNMNVRKRLKDIFGFTSFRTYNGEPLQEEATQAAVYGKSLLAIFPTGGGKSLTFQLPALIAGETSRALTVVISPLQSLMKDQVDNLEEKGIVDAVAINGLLSPIERSEAMARVENGMASLLYISPESLRSNSIEKLLLSRNVVRFVIDEAHCFSAWGQDFRVDYMYIGDFIRKLQEKKRINHKIAVSCFTATAKQKVISDIQDYFKEKLDIELELFTTNATRSNLHYAVLYRENDEAKYMQLRELIRDKNCPTIVYVSRVKRTVDLAKRLTEDGLLACPFNGKMDSNVKIANQEAFINNEVQVIVATSAFGMGVDKKDVRLVIHYDISDSLENYVQEAGRAGRNEDIQAECYVLFNDEDLDKHFILLNQTKLSISEIQQVWKAIKDLTRTHNNICCSALEIARQAGWDDSLYEEMETRVKTAIAALENAGYIERGKNVPKIYANSILMHSMKEASAVINSSPKFTMAQKQIASRIMSYLFSSRSIAKAGNDEAESRVDYIADRLGIPKEDVINVIMLLREEKILEDHIDLTAFVHKSGKINKSKLILKRFVELENYLAEKIFQQEEITTYAINYKEINEEAIRSGIKNATIKDIKTILYFWTIRGYIYKNIDQYGRKFELRRKIEPKLLFSQIDNRIELAGFIVEYLYQHSPITEEDEKGLVPVQFSVLELQKAFNERDLLKFEQYYATAEDVQNALLYLSKIDAVDLQGGFLVLYNGLHLKRLVTDNKISYKKKDYEQLNEYYKHRIQQIHIVGEYANMMVKDYEDALQFVKDYFQLDYKFFLAKYFKGNRREEIDRNITSSKYDKLFGGLSNIQAKIINDDVQGRHIVVSACPGSGKTRVLVHKLASLMLLEDVKHEQLLMLTFSRAAATEFKSRLIELIGNAAHYIEIRTFHSYCFDLLGRIGNLEDSTDIVKKAGDLIRSGEVEMGRITKTVLVIDEAQDMDENEFLLVCALLERNDGMRVIAVGDDDQNIYGFRGSNSGYMFCLESEYKATKYEMMLNYRSKQYVVSFANEFAKTIRKRFKYDEMVSNSDEKGRVVLTKYISKNIEIPIVENIKKNYKCGSVCVLTATNDEALRVMGLLMKENIKARLIQSNDGFNLLNLIEIRFFMEKLSLHSGVPIIQDEIWDQAKKALLTEYKGSTCLPACEALINIFEKTNRKKYLTDFEEFVKESNYEDFIDDGKEVILVSTMHKAKGREFDSVYLMLNNYQMLTDEAKRAVYVAITRAKNELYIHCNNDSFDPINCLGLETYHDNSLYSVPDEIMLQLTHKDVVLDFFKNKKEIICGLKSGEDLEPDEDYLCTKRNKRKTKVIKLSQKARTQLLEFKKQNYVVAGAEIRFIVAWKGEGDEDESAVILPNIYLRKNNLNSKNTL